MAHLIDKSALVAEIKRRKQVAFGWMETAPNDAIEAEFELCDDILSFIKSLEVKEVDLDVMQRMEECPYRKVGCTMYEGHILECRGACSWVVDYPKLKEFKARKREEV